MSLQSPLSFRQPQDKDSGVEPHHSGHERDCLSDSCEANIESLSDPKEEPEFCSDDEDVMLRYAIMLSLQEDIEDDFMNASSNYSEIASAASHNLRSIVPLPVPYRNSTIMQPSALADLPMELRELICSYIFLGETIVVKPEKVPEPKFLITWGPHLSLLLVSREFNCIATRYLACAEVVLDLRQFHTRSHTIGRNSFFALKIEDLLCNAPNLASVCSKLMIRQGQHLDCDYLDLILPALTNVELYDYKSCREILRESGLYSGSMFEYEVPMKTRPRATEQFEEFQESLPYSVCADLIYVCDTLVCIPKHEDEIARVENSERTGIGKIMSRVKNAAKIGDKNKSDGTSQETVEQGSRFKTAKMRHLILFNRFCPEGIWLSKEWVVAGLGVQSLSLGDIIAIHCHEYCLELVDRGETVGV